MPPPISRPAPFLSPPPPFRSRPPPPPPPERQPLPPFPPSFLLLPLPFPPDLLPASSGGIGMLFCHLACKRIRGTHATHRYTHRLRDTQTHKHTQTQRLIHRDIYNPDAQYVQHTHHFGNDTFHFGRQTKKTSQTVPFSMLSVRLLVRLEL